jgi:hypothetical protein
VSPVPLTQVTSDKLKVLIHGPQGSGKTTLATSAAEVHPVLWIDFPGELGVSSLKGAPYEANIDREEVTRTEQLNTLYDTLARGKHRWGTIVIDSLSAVQVLFARQIQHKQPGDIHDFSQPVADFGHKGWGQMLEHMTDLVVFFYRFAAKTATKPVNVVMTAQTKMHKDEDTQEVRVIPAIRGASLELATSAADHILYCFTEEEYADDLSTPVGVGYRVRIGPHPLITTKLRRPIGAPVLPAVVGQKGRLTMHKLAKLLEKEL